MKPNDYVLTNKGKLGKIILPGGVDYPNQKFTPASVQLNKRVYEIWPENLTPVDHVDLDIMDEGTLILTAEKAFNLIQVLLRNRIPVKIDLQTTKYLNS